MQMYSLSQNLLSVLLVELNIYLCVDCGLWMVDGRMAPVSCPCFPSRSSSRDRDRDRESPTHQLATAMEAEPNQEQGENPVSAENERQEPTEEQKRAYEHAGQLHRWVVNCTPEEKPYSTVSTVTDPNEVYKPLIPVGTDSEYRGVNINKMTTEVMAESLRGFFSYQRPGFVTDLSHKPGWVLFEHGTYVIIPEPGPGPVADYKREAISFMNRFGQVLMGCQAADITMFHVKPEIHNGVSGWVVFGEFPMIGTFVRENELDGVTHANEDEDMKSMLVAYYGREKRHLDATKLVVVHEERGGPGSVIVNA